MLGRGRIVVVDGGFGPAGLAALFLVQSASLLLLGILQETRLPVGSLCPYMSGVGVLWLAQRSPRARLAVIRPACIVAACSSGGVMVAVAPVRTVIRVRRLAVWPR